MKKVVVWFLILLSLIAILLRFSSQLGGLLFGIKQTSGISVLSDPQDATVFLDGKEMGKSPYENKNLEVRNYSLRLQKDQLKWEGKIRLNPGAITVINRDLATDSASSAGESLSLQKGKGLTIVSNPSESEVEIDGKNVGKTPLTTDTAIGEHTILLSHSNYLKRSIRATLPENYNLTISVDLALSEADLSSIQVPTITQTAQVVVKNTPTGFLRVRDKPSLNGKEIARAKPGDKFVLLEELGEWDRVRLVDTTEGYVSTAYLEKVAP